MRGSGETTYNKPVQNYKEIAVDILLLMKEKFSDINEYQIFGHDIGASVAVELALLDSLKVKGIVLLDLPYKYKKYEELRD